ncbi:leucine-rich repeat domain-containing protein [Desulfosporosinus sp. PR]|uniref:leucine-rich repeat domain-containing protein n=1 Tax=Candidatus Desulfosporosinus nitrosoreducens TaxID=3401928 RepID=UPI0027F537BB|nr:leucine-rich repeat domain-containing protein [Desulfosporosinus sp. PR]MDQ7093935.1 leucine-rich repeat domain-containing protein [Desulfosporosinus sp. PR]
MKKILCTKSKRLLAATIIGIMLTSVSTPVLASTGDIWNGSTNIGNVIQLILHPSIFLDLITHTDNYSYEVNGKGYNIEQVDALFKKNPTASATTVQGLIETQLTGTPITGASNTQDFNCTITGGKATITGYTGPGGDIEIPSMISGIPVSSIGEYAFYNCTGLTSITIPTGVTSIGDNAFNACRGLTNISIPQGVTSIGDSAFFNCTGLASISIPDSVTVIGNGAFDYCTGLTSISIPQGITSIGYQTFADCSRLTNIIIPQGITSIGYQAFADCWGLNSISIPQGVTSIGKSAFFNCTGLNSIRFNSTTTTIYDDQYTLPATTKIIGYDPSTAKDYATKYNRTFEAIK